MRRKITVVGLCFISIFLLSCQTVQQNPGAATEAGVGAAAGGVAGALIGRGAGAVLLGGLLGALAGGVVGHYAYDVPRSREDTARAYRYDPAQGTILRIENASASPHAVYPGEIVNLRITYAVLTPAPYEEVTVREIRQVTYHNEVVGNPEVRVERTGGTYASSIPLELPPNAERGTYEVRNMVESRYGSDTMVTYFRVE